jgi:hypothetical protein
MFAMGKDNQAFCAADTQGDQMRLWKSRPKCSPTHIFGQNECIAFTVEKVVQNVAQPIF